MSIDIKALKVFENIIEFEEFYKQYNVFKRWEIRDAKLNDRAEIIKDKEYFLDFKKDFNEKELYKEDVKDTEVVTWIDTITLMKKIIDEIANLNYVYLKEISILMEFKIPFGKYKRIDYIICFRNVVIIIEFGFDNIKDKEQIQKYNQKLYEVIEYKNILSGILSNNIKIIGYPFIYKPENNEENINYNIENIKEFAKFLLQVFINNPNAYNELDFANHFYEQKD